MSTAENAALGTSIAALPLRAVRHRAIVVGLQQEVTVTQEYGNDLDHSVEAVYVFPLPAEAAVLGVEMRIGAKTVISELRERKDALREYEDARDRGHHAALLEQERPNIFTISVAGIEPTEAISVTVRYLAPVAWQDSGGRLSIPLVVAPRFIPGMPTGTQGRGWAPDTDEVPDASRITPRVVSPGVEVPYTASVEITLDPGFPCRVESPSHGAMVGGSDLKAGEEWMLVLDNLRPDRDVILTYRTTAQLPTVKVDRTTFTLKDGCPEEFVLLQLAPGAWQEPTDPLDVVLVLDKSGSMDGPKIVGLKQIAAKALDRFAAFSRPVRVGVVVYDDEVHAQLALSPLGERHHAAIRDIPTSGGGGTNTHHALNTAMHLFGREDDDRERCVILVTDGQFGGAYDGKRGVRIHVVGIDTAVNDAFLNDLARLTGGGKYFLRPGEDYDAAASTITAFASGPVVRGVALRGLPEEAVATGVDDLYASRPATIAVQIPARVCGFTVTGRGTDGRPLEWAIDVPKAQTTEVASRLWARSRLKEVESRDAQVSLSLRYGIVCSATAFVAVSLKEVPGQKPERVDIPVLLPETWNYEAVFGGDVGGYATLGAPGAYRRAAGQMTASCSSMRCGGFDFANVLKETFEAADTPRPAPSVGTTQQLLMEAEAFLAQLTCGRDVFEADWQRFTTALAAETFCEWSELDRACLYEVLVKLRTYGFAAVIPKAIEAEPTDVDARNAWVRARRGLGHATP